MMFRVELLGYTVSLLMFPRLSYGPICNEYAARQQDCAAQAANHQGHFPLLFPGRQDRPARLERFRQVDRTQNHGGRR